MKYQQIVEAVNKIIAEYSVKLTVRQIYYRLVSPPFQIIPNTQTAYKGFDKILTRAREKEDVDWQRIEDRARRTIGGEGSCFEDPFEYVDWLSNENSSKYYSKYFWEDQPQYIEVWVEKDALASIFDQACEDYRVVIFPSRGYSSFTKVMEACQRFPGDKTIKILHFTDHDPSGLDMTADIEKRFEEYYGEVEIERVALTIEQVKMLDLPPNPTKSADARTPKYEAQYGSGCWELDSVPPNTLSQWIKEAVENEIDDELWDETEAQIDHDRSMLNEALKSAKTSFGKAFEEMKAKMREIEGEP